MKVVHLQTTDMGGSYRAVKLIHEGLLQKGVDSQILLRTKHDPDSIGTEVIATLPAKLISRAKNVINNIHSKNGVSTMLFGTDMSKYPEVLNSDVIMIHWTNSFLSDKDIQKLTHLGKKTVLVTHDMYYMTGGCPTDGYCGGYSEECKNCPKNDRLSNRNFRRKSNCYKDIDLVVGPSKWINSVARESGILQNHKIVCIPNPLDTKVFRHFTAQEKADIREAYGISKDKKVILYGMAASFDDENKASASVKDVLGHLNNDKYQLVVFGNCETDRLEGVSLETRYLGYVKGEDNLAKVYAMADVFLTTSAQESYGYTVAEALSVGVMVVAYRIGGIMDQVEHEVNGYLAERGCTEELAEGIEYCIQHSYLEEVNQEVNGRANGEARQEMKVDGSQEVKEGTNQEVNGRVNGEARQEVKEGTDQEVNGRVNGEACQEVKEDANREVKEEACQDAFGDTNAGVSASKEAEATNSIENIGAKYLQILTDI